MNTIKEVFDRLRQEMDEVDHRMYKDDLETKIFLIINRVRFNMLEKELCQHNMVDDTTHYLIDNAIEEIK